MVAEPLSHGELLSIAQAAGFSFCAALRPVALGACWAGLYRSRPPHTQGLCVDPPAAYPWATALVLIARAYEAFAVETGLPGYYIASNAGYHAAKGLCGALTDMGYRAERVEVPLPALVTISGIGRLLKNGLIDIPGLGTRTALFTFVTDAVAPGPDVFTPPPACGDCTRCARACPASAIDPAHGLAAQRCLRTYMEDAVMPEWVEERLPGLLGCEICQAACPRNAGLNTRMPTPEEQDAFDLERLAQGDIAAARALVGKNMCTHGRLQAQAQALLRLRVTACRTERPQGAR